VYPYAGFSGESLSVGGPLLSRNVPAAGRLHDPADRYTLEQANRWLYALTDGLVWQADHAGQEPKSSCSGGSGGQQDGEQPTVPWQWGQYSEQRAHSQLCGVQTAGPVLSVLFAAAPGSEPAEISRKASCLYRVGRTDKPLPARMNPVRASNSRVTPAGAGRVWRMGTLAF
jgi:hypothetical protein